LLDFNLATTPEIRKELCNRLRVQRIAQGWSQLDLAKRAGVSGGTVKNLENKGQATLDSFIHILCALGLADECAELFKIKPLSISAMEKAETQRQRAPRKRRQ
jgi:transcriptional regulator with XRE-family HTH domain